MFLISVLPSILYSNSIKIFKNSWLVQNDSLSAYSVNLALGIIFHFITPYDLKSQLWNMRIYNTLIMCIIQSMSRSQIGPPLNANYSFCQRSRYGFHAS
jgi:hypothetical protein